MTASNDLSARIEPFDSFWEGPKDIEKGYAVFSKFYRHNYLKYVPPGKDSKILIISCGPGYFADLLAKQGYTNVTGIDSDAEKIGHARMRGLPCQTARAFEFLQQNQEPYDAILCEQELNHLTKPEMLEFLTLCRHRLREGGTLIAHTLNGANPMTGAEALAQNFDHFNTLTEYSFRQVLDHCRFTDIKIFPLNLYVFWFNPLNYLLLLIAGCYDLFFRLSFMLYGKKNRLFSKKIGAACLKNNVHADIKNPHS